jgi:CheY-like chemotaxis protein
MAYVLVIDDSDMVCELARVVLTMEGHEVVTTTDSREGERLIYETTTPSIVLLNLTMPPPNGIDILEHLRTVPEVRGRHAIILYSASPHLATVARDCAADGYLTKPAKGSQIIDAVNRALHTLQARAARM